MSPGSGRRRLDVAMVDDGMVESRARAQSLIVGGHVTVDGETVSRPAAIVGPGARIDITQEVLPYVSRGGLKLEHALQEFGMDVKRKICIDVGASTGGFTDVLLQAGAAKVYAVDVGYGQLAWTLRNDPRVVVMERTNVRHLAELPELGDLGVVDVSFISLRLVLPVLRSLLRQEGEAVALIKPQFEAGPKQVGKKGVVRDSAVWRDVLRSVLSTAEEDGWRVSGLTRSPIRGPAGNVEFLAHLMLDPAAQSIDALQAIDAVTAVTER